MSTPDAAATAERRPLSVLSCTLAEAERLALQLEAEDHYELMYRFRTVCVEMVTPYGGHVAQQSDAGLVIYLVTRRRMKTLHCAPCVAPWH